MDNYRKYFIRAINKNYPDSYQLISEETERHYQHISLDTQFAYASGNPMDKRLDFSSYFLAFIKTMDERAEAFETIRRLCIEITIDCVRPKNKAQAFIKKLVPALISTNLGRVLVKQLHKKVSINSSKEGFIANIITDKQETFGFGYGVDIIECGICKLFKKHDYFKYASILCEVDEITSAMAGLELIRNGTIALGAKKCDFRFKRKNSSMSN